MPLSAGGQRPRQSVGKQCAELAVECAELSVGRKAVQHLIVQAAGVMTNSTDSSSDVSAAQKQRMG